MYRNVMYTRLMSFQQFFTRMQQVEKPTKGAAMLNKFCPQLRFHEAEQYFPCSIEWYLNRSNLADESGHIICLAPTPDMLRLHNNPAYQLEFDPGCTNGQGDNQLNDVPVYVGMFEESEFVYLQYCFLYAYNGASALFAKCSGLNTCGCEAGEHFGELERITVKVVRATEEIDSVYFGAHRRHDGCWRKAGEFETTATGAPVVYVALGSHACYPESAQYPRICGLTCDYTSNKGRFWNPQVKLIDNDTNWNTFRGYLGQPRENHVPRQHEWWGGNESTRSANWFTRLFCCCVCSLLNINAIESVRCRHGLSIVESRVPGRSQRTCV